VRISIAEHSLRDRHCRDALGATPRVAGPLRIAVMIAIALLLRKRSFLISVEPR
jgi:hypothetical protein